jgi:hypothetical protein
VQKGNFSGPHFNNGALAMLERAVLGFLFLCVMKAVRFYEWLFDHWRAVLSALMAAVSIIWLYRYGYLGTAIAVAIAAVLVVGLAGWRRVMITKPK